MFLFGMHVGVVAPAVPKALAGHVAPQHLGRANGLALLAYTLGTALTMISARTVLVPLLGGWRPVMVAAGALMAVVGVLFLLLAQDRTVPSRHAPLRQILALCRDGQLLRGGFIYFLLFGGYLALLGLLPRALGETGLKPGHVGLAVAGWLAGAGIANFVGPWLSDRTGRRRPFIIGGSLVAAAGYGAFALLGAPEGLRARAGIARPPNRRNLHLWNSPQQASDGVLRVLHPAATGGINPDGGPTATLDGPCSRGAGGVREGIRVRAQVVSVIRRRML